MIETPKLKMMTFTEANVSAEYINWLNDASLMQYSEQRHYLHSYESCLAYFKSFNFKQNIFLAIILKENNQHIGNINAYVDSFNQTADVGILIGAKDIQGRGLGAEAWFALMAYLFNKRGVRKITAGTMSCNLGMLKIMKKTFMSPDSVSKKQFLVKGEEVDLVRYALFADDFKKLTSDDPSLLANFHL